MQRHQAGMTHGRTMGEKQAVRSGDRSCRPVGWAEESGQCPNPHLPGHLGPAWLCQTLTLLHTDLHAEGRQLITQGLHTHGPQQAWGGMCLTTLEMLSRLAESSLRPQLPPLLPAGWLRGTAEAKGSSSSGFQPRHMVLAEHHSAQSLQSGVGSPQTCLH